MFLVSGKFKMVTRDQFQWENRFLAGWLMCQFLCLLTAWTASLLGDQMTRNVQPSCILCQSIYTIYDSITVSKACYYSSDRYHSPLPFLIFTDSFISNDTGFSMQLFSFFNAICLLAAILEMQSPLVLLESGWVIKWNFNKMKLPN